MLSTALIIGFVGASFFSALALFAACVAVGRVPSKRGQYANYSDSVFSSASPIIDVEWRRLDEQPA